MKMNKVGSSILVWFLVAAVAVLWLEVRLAAAVNCSPLELSACSGAVMGGQAPSATCCNKLREQRPCLCGYLRNPNLKQYVNSPGARRAAATCGVPTPNC